ncbi:putative XPG domain-containing protein [Colletotrichum karsti]|uniref:XPG domain-containing protein n=1 Tax=Colletotrichum karsti TaxID=1095194 RepID=A0A9P6LQR7_9PEZI|nr:putative XPG domain-containing protein [Colletotrichum karsti]KAF9881057.1 putative XPG domain-containing protein [Colletotrichum karsti]
MVVLVEDAWINNHASTHNVSELDDCAIAIDATYYLQLFLDTPPAHEPLLPALGGMTGIEYHLRADIEQWKANNITPFFIFDGQSLAGQEEVAVQRGKLANQKTNEAWSLYFNSEAEKAVTAFGQNSGAFRIQNLYPLLKSILKDNNLHFLVPPYNASAQLAYFDMIDSDQCAAVMGSQELLLYPIRDTVIRSIDWEAKQATSVSKKKLLHVLNIAESMLHDALLMTGTSFLPPFPPLQDVSLYPRQSTVNDAVNLLRASEKSVQSACSSYGDVLKSKDPNWLDKYRKARMAVHHFIYVSEDGEVKVTDYEHITSDNHLYLGLQLPGELYHYLNTGLISARVLDYITYSRIIVTPTLDGVASEQYKKLITNQLIPLKEQSIGLIIPRLHRGLQHKPIHVKVWFDDNFSHEITKLLQPSPTVPAATWDVKDSSFKIVDNIDEPAGSIAFEFSALLFPEFVKATFPQEKRITGIDSIQNVTAVAIWRFLHLRGYVDDSHTLTNWGNAVASAIWAMKDSLKDIQLPDGLNIFEAILAAFELIRFDVLNARHRHEELNGAPVAGSDEDKASIVLISRCASLLKLRHEANGYTGPLNKNLLLFRSLSNAVREADRDLVEAIVASMFLYAQSKRDRDDYLEISTTLPFLYTPDIALGIAVKTFMDEIPAGESKEKRQARLADFSEKFFPYATNFRDDVQLAFAFFDAINKGVQTLNKEVSAADKAVWSTASKYLDQKRF